MKELLADKRGFLMSPVEIHRDPFGNGRRYWVSFEDEPNEEGIKYLKSIYEKSNDNLIDGKRIRYSCGDKNE
jgi:hypothetical protein